ncbi:N utilization substance protein B homolog [uncultured Desulfobacterium sp.]|uniref:Transcription antitermination protein NusB n=1 Tax=uncultured Desulfobacterium sp. TaxID=201089 RepID=A0A445N3D3_9BACT|nr:N utilization substance protein B homolog [uncultured Desulfobacterium sp.]
MGKRRQGRELAIQALFHLEYNPDNHPDKAFDLICDNFDSLESIRPFSRHLVLGVCEKRDQLDELIRNASKNWRLERMSVLDRCILRLAAFEILFMEDVPPKVSIDEALEMGKKFGSEDSSSFINGILDNIYNTLREQGLLKGKENGA